ncbi:hypothetical protein HC081234_18530 [Helicobacter cinaedi]|nr:hypothetical protein HC081234_18530 [Helicobacter cinaedi]
MPFLLLFYLALSFWLETAIVRSQTLALTLSKLLACSLQNAVSISKILPLFVRYKIEYANSKSCLCGIADFV